MKYRPILFTSGNVLAILDGRKTMTRRVVRPQPMPSGIQDGKSVFHKGEYRTEILRCPYGIPEDKLWVREKWRVASVNHEMGKPAQFYTVQFENYGVLPHPQPDQNLFLPLVEKDDLECSKTGIGFGKWRPSIFMPRWASRITLEITDVRVERLQEISVDDCYAVGIRNQHYTRGTVGSHRQPRTLHTQA